MFTVRRREFMVMRSMIIVGAGIAGLSTGCYALMNGYDATIFEMHDRPGGMCTSWSRKGYVFDYAIHNLAGTRPGSKLREMWDEIHALEDIEIIDHDYFQVVESSDGRRLFFYTDIDRLRSHLKELSPGDSRAIDAYIKTVRSFAYDDFFGMGFSKLAMIGKMGKLMRFIKTTIGEYGKGFQDPFLREAFGAFQYNMADAPMIANLMFMVGLSNGDLGWPKGGSLAFSRRIESRFLDLGGEIGYGSRVKRIIVDGNRAVGVELEDGSQHFADLIVSAADGRTTIYDMLEGKYINDRIRSYYQNPPESEPFGIGVNLGVNRDLANEAHHITLLLDEPLSVEDGWQSSIFLELYDDSTGLAPSGKGVIKADLVGSYEYWRSLSVSRELYRSKKSELAERVIQVLERRFPGLRSQIEVVDVTTPVTCERYTGNLHGYQPWPPPKDARKVMKEGLSKTLPGLRGFFMVGQWAGATIGISTVALMARQTVQDICVTDGKRFVTQKG